MTTPHTSPADSPTGPADSVAVVATDRPARYAKQLASHLGRRARTTWDDDTRRGTVAFGDDGDGAVLTCRDDALVLELTASPAVVARLEDVLGRHLVRFGSRDELVVTWRRADGSAGTRQVNEADDQG